MTRLASERSDIVETPTDQTHKDTDDGLTGENRPGVGLWVPSDSSLPTFPGLPSFSGNASLGRDSFGQSVLGVELSHHLWYHVAWMGF